MTCRTLMMTPSATLTPEDTVATALARLGNGIAPSLPVIDADGRFLGLFGRREALALMLPRAASLGGDEEELAWMDESLHDFGRRLTALAAQPVASHLVQPVTLGPDDGAAEAVRLLSRGAPLVPVVDGDGRLLGVIAAYSILARATGRGAGGNG